MGVPGAHRATMGDRRHLPGQHGGLAPPRATKQSHKAIRDLCKTCVLGTNYGMQARGLATRTGPSVIETQDLLHRLARTFLAFTRGAPVKTVWR